MIAAMTTKQSPGGESGAQEVLGSSLSLDELDRLAVRVDGAFVVLIRLNAPDHAAVLPEPLPAKYRRRVFMSVAAAQRAATAAVGRGETVRVYLAELRPLHRLSGHEGTTGVES